VFGEDSNLRESFNMTRFALSATAILLSTLASTGNAEQRKITDGEKNFCADAYHKYCGEYGLDSSALRDCMSRNGKNLPSNCIDALVDAGEVSKDEVERRKQSGH
jgi:hypothetical protein